MNKKLIVVDPIGSIMLASIPQIATNLTQKLLF
jgi:hypothetical protein